MRNRNTHKKKFRLPIPISLHSGLNHNHLYQTFNRASSLHRKAWHSKIYKNYRLIYCASYFNSGGVEICLHLAVPISLHLVLVFNVGKVFALPSLFPYIWC